MGKTAPLDFANGGERSALPSHSKELKEADKEANIRLAPSAGRKVPNASLQRDQDLHRAQYAAGEFVVLIGMLNGSTHPEEA
jgi:hypothetical protein